MSRHVRRSTSDLLPRGWTFRTKHRAITFVLAMARKVAYPMVSGQAGYIVDRFNGWNNENKYSLYRFILYTFRIVHIGSIHSVLVSYYAISSKCSNRRPKHSTNINWSLWSLLNSYRAMWLVYTYPWFFTSTVWQVFLLPLGFRQPVCTLVNTSSFSEHFNSEALPRVLSHAF